MTGWAVLKILIIIIAALGLAFIAKHASETAAVTVLAVGLFAVGFTFYTELARPDGITQQAEAAFPGTVAGALVIGPDKIGEAINAAMKENDGMEKLKKTLDIMVLKAKKGELPGQRNHRKGEK